jgi:hypothetical protein
LVSASEETASAVQDDLADAIEIVVQRRADRPLVDAEDVPDEMDFGGRQAVTAAQDASLPFDAAPTTANRAGRRGAEACLCDMIEDALKLRLR